MTDKLANYRLRISSPSGGTTYIVRRNGKVNYMGADETSFALANLIHTDAAAMRFKLEDAEDGEIAAYAVHTALQRQWKNNPDRCPQVEVI